MGQAPALVCPSRLLDYAGWHRLRTLSHPLADAPAARTLAADRLLAAAVKVDCRASGWNVVGTTRSDRALTRDKLYVKPRKVERPDLRSRQPDEPALQVNLDDVPVVRPDGRGPPAGR